MDGRRRQWQWLAAAAVAVLFSSGSRAAEPPATELAEVVVTAQRYATPVLTTPSFTTVIRGDDLQRRGARSAAEAVRGLGGLDYVSYGPLGSSQGGMNSELPVRGVPDGELVLVDGQALNNPSGGGYDLNTIPVSAIERIEVVRGANSALYGSAAMTGVINIITRKPQGREATVQSEAGNDAFVRSTVSVADARWLASISHTHLGALDRIAKSHTGFWEYDQMPTDDYGALIRLEPVDGLTAGWLGSRETTGFVRNPWPDRRVTTSNSHRGSVQEGNRNLATLAWEHDGFSLQGNYLSDLLWYRTDNAPELNATDYFRWGANPQYHGSISEMVEYLVGADGQVDRVKSSAYGTRTRRNWSGYGTVTLRPWQALAVTLGGRHQWVTQKDAADYSTFMPTAQASWQVAEKVVLYANAGRAFRAPDLTRLYRVSNLVRGNPDLKPEHGWTYEVGGKYDGEWFDLTVAPFLMRYKDKIEFDRTLGNPLTYYNTGYYRSTGVEWDLGITPHEHWQVSFAGCYADAEFVNAQNSRTQTGAEWQLKPSLAFDNGTVNVTVSQTMLCDRQNALADFVSTDATVGIALPDGWGEFTVGVTNLFDRENATAGDLSGASRYEYYEAGRSIRAGLRLDF